MADEPTYHSHASAAYTLPNDAPEHDRLEAQCRAFDALLGGNLFQAPNVGTGQGSIHRAVDIGCGTGYSTVRLAAKEPTAQVIGVDLSPVPAIHPQPDNVQYVQGEVSELEGSDERLQAGSFDYTYNRILLWGITDWSRFIKTHYSLLKPGGWAEIQEPEFVVRDANGTDVSDRMSWIKTLRTAMGSVGLVYDGGQRVEQWMRNTGFVDVQRKVYLWPYSDKPWEAHPETHEMGIYTKQILLPQLLRMQKKTLEGAGKSKQEMDEFEREVRSSVDDLPEGAHMRLFVTYGRKP